MLGWMTHKLGSGLLGKISITSDVQMTPPLMAESEEELKSLKAQHSKNEDNGIRFHHFMANRWGNNGKSGKLFFWAPKSLQMVTVTMKSKDTCSLEEKL